MERATEHARRLDAVTRITRLPTAHQQRFERSEQRLSELAEELRSTAFTILGQIEQMGKRLDRCCELSERSRDRLDALEAAQQPAEGS